MCTFIFYKYFLNLEDTRCLNFQIEFLQKVFSDSCSLGAFFWFFFTFAATCSFHTTTFLKFPLEWTALFFLLLRQCCGVQPCTHANSTLCSMRYWLVSLVTGLFLGCSACYWLVPWLFRLLLACSLLVPLVTGLFRVLATSFVMYHIDEQIQLMQRKNRNKWERSY